MNNSLSAVRIVAAHITVHRVCTGYDHHRDIKFDVMRLHNAIRWCTQPNWFCLTVDVSLARQQALFTTLTDDQHIQNMHFVSDARWKCT